MSTDSSGRPAAPSWEDFRLFLAVAEAGSFSAAARRLRLGQPTVSRRIALLEEQAGEALFQRGAGGSGLTAAGERLLPLARRMAEAAGELWRLASQGEARPEGLVRITAPPGVAVDFLAPFARHVSRVHRGLRLEVLSGIDYLDLARGEADLALRLRLPAQRELLCLGTLEAPVAAYASRRYAARLPAGYGPADVDWITWAPPHDRLPPRPALEALIPGFQPAFTSDSFLVQWQAAEAGVGAMIMAPMRHRFARPSSLVRLTLTLPVRGTRLHLIGPRSNLGVPRVRAVIDLLLAELASVQGGQLWSSPPLP